MSKPQFQILVCTNERPPDATKPSCGHRGGLDVYRRFKDVVRKRGLRDQVMSVRTGCLKHCSQGTTVCLWPQNLWLRQVTVDDVEAIVEQAIVQGQGAEADHRVEPDQSVLDRLAMPDIAWE